MTSTDFYCYDFWDKFITIVGFIISIWTLLIARNAKKAVDLIQQTFTFDKRVPEQLKNIDKHLTSLNNLLNNPTQNIHEINSLLGNIGSELKNLKSKIHDNYIKKLIDIAISQIKFINKITYNKTYSEYIVVRKFSELLYGKPQSLKYKLRQNYVKISEIYTAVHNVYQDSKTNLNK